MTLMVSDMNGLIIDCFAGGGGASKGIELALNRPIDIAINHDPEAIRIHKANHPHTLHLTEDIFTVDLQKYVAGRKVDLMWASPDCTSHSKAKGGQPRHQGLRILPWAVYKHAKAILPEIIIMENVEEIQQWGPLDGTGRPIKERAGEDYNKFIQAMCSLGYAFDSQELVAADYGAPTTRKRWYAIFRRDQRPITWPVATHSKDGGHGTQKWLSCGDFIDWVAFLIQYHGETKAGDARGQLLTEPIKTIDTSNRYGLVTAFVTKFYKTGTGQSCREPLHTITTSPGHFGLVSAFLIKYYGTGCGQTLEEPLATITTKDRFGLVNVVVELDGEKYILKDIFLRMLKAEPELKLMQGFPADYIITHDYDGKLYPIKEQVARIGNSVVPIMAKALVQANCPHLIKEAMTA